MFSLKEFMINALRGSLSYTELVALDQVSFSVGKGEILGVIGRNGAGKSTLLKVISRVLEPSEGKCTVRGRISPILELGTGFDFELTGRENVFLNALLRGHRRPEIEAAFEEIVEFSGLREFIDSPVRNYSTGMVARLGFAVATAWTPDVLVLDEVFAVGDARFVARCKERIDQFCASGTTVIIVSHNPNEILGSCGRCIWLDKGLIRADGPPAEVVARYTEVMAAPEDPAEHAPEAGQPQDPSVSDNAESVGAGDLLGGG